MNFTIKHIDITNNSIEVSFDVRVETTTIVLPSELFNVENDQLILTDSVNTYINGFRPSTEYLDAIPSSYENPPRIHIPPYLASQRVLMKEVEALAARGAVIVVDNDSIETSEYVLLNDRQQDLIYHQQIRPSDSDQYIYLYNRLMLLTHLKGMLDVYVPSKIQTGLIDQSKLHDIEPIEFCVPRTLEELTAFVSDTCTYRITQTLQDVVDTEVLTAQGVIDRFTTQMFEDNATNHNVISCQPSRQAWIVEENTFDQLTTVKGYVRRPDLIADTGVSAAHRGVVVVGLETEPEEVQYALRCVLQLTFFYYASHFMLRYTVRNGILYIVDIQPQLDLDAPSIERVYCS